MSEKYKKQKTHAEESDNMFQQVSEWFEEVEVDIKDAELNRIINMYFLWEQVSFVKPFDNMSEMTVGKEWRLMYRTQDGLEYHSHLKVKESSLEEAGHGLFADRTFYAGDIISVYVGANVRSKRNLERENIRVYKSLLWGQA